MLLGADMFFTTLTSGLIRRKEATLVNTAFGWVVGGNLASPSHTTLLTRNTKCTGLIKDNDTCLENQLTKFFELEPNDDLRLTKDTDCELCEQHFALTHHRKPDGQFTVQIPIKSNPPPLGDTFFTAQRQLNQLWRRLSKNEDMKKLYCDFMSEYEALGHMEKIEGFDNHKFGKVISYLPHHGVLKPTSSSTKLRVVFNASQRSMSGFTLNDTMINGGIVQPKLTEVFVRFRAMVHVICADIKKMYRQIAVDESQQNMQRIVWKNNEKDPISIYRLKTVTYGTASAPYLATRVLNQLAKDGASEFPLASKALLQNTYVDDIMSGADSVAEALEMQRQLIELLDGAAMTLHKWCSNTSQILELVPECAREPLISLNEKFDAVVKTLGMLWDSKMDVFTYKIQLAQSDGSTTKRSALSQIASIFDPLGLLAPVIVTYKLFIQTLWKQKNLEWDTPISAEDEARWQTLRKNLVTLETLTIPRCIKPDSAGLFELHGFADASGYAYGACIYLVSKSINGIVTNSSLIVAKSKVGPQQSISIPRMELLAATMLAKLMSDTRVALNLKIMSSTCWSDSTTVLVWISTPNEMLKQFCANRVALI